MSHYRLTTSFPYLARRVGVRIGELFDNHIAPFGVTVSMYRVLAVLIEQDSRRLGDISHLVSIEMSTLSRLIGTMTRKGLVTRRRPSGNGRVVEISLTVRGRALAVQLMPIAEQCESVAVSGLSQEDVARLKKWLEVAYQNLDKLESELAAEAAKRKPAKPRRGGRDSVRSRA